MVNCGLVVITIFCCHFCWTGGRTNSGRTNIWTWTEKQMDGWTNRKMDGWTDGWTNEQRDGRGDRQMDGWSDGWTDGLTNRQTDNITKNKHETEFWRHPNSDAINNNLRPVAFRFQYSFCWSKMGFDRQKIFSSASM